MQWRSHLGGLAQRPYDIGYIVALLHGVKHPGGAARSLNHHGNGALFTVPAGNGDGNTLALLIKAEDNKLACHGMARNKGCFNLKKAYGFCLVEETLCHYFIHLNTSMKNLYFLQNLPPCIVQYQQAIVKQIIL